MILNSINKLIKSSKLSKFRDLHIMQHHIVFNSAYGNLNIENHQRININRAKIETL